MIYVAMDDTDNLESRGTGRLAREVAADLAKDYRIAGVTRHQLFVHDAIPYTSHNSCAVIHLEDGADTGAVFERVKKLMLDDFVEGSDPGLAVAASGQIDFGVIVFGQDAKRIVVDQKRARAVAANAGIRLEGLGGTEGGVIGAVAGLGLAHVRNDGRYLLKGKNREISGVQPVSVLLGAGIDRVMTLDGRIIGDGHITLNKSPTPSVVLGKAVLFVEEGDDGYVALKRE